MSHFSASLNYPVLVSDNFMVIGYRTEKTYTAWFPKLIKDKKLIEGVQKELQYLNEKHTIWRWSEKGSSCLVSILIDPGEIWLRSFNITYGIYSTNPNLLLINQGSINKEHFFSYRVVDS